MFHAEIDPTSARRDNTAMRLDKSLRATVPLLVATALAAPLLTFPPVAAQTVPLGPNPSECEIQAALLGSAGPGCPPVAMKRPPPQPAEAPATAPAAPATVAVPSLPETVALPTVGLKAAFRVNFDFNSARMRPESRAVLDRVAAVMAAPTAGGTRFRIVGHTDAIGGDKANLALSQRRAKAVVDYLVERHGIPRDRLDASGMGTREPLIPTNPKAAENRRVEIVNLGG